MQIDNLIIIFFLVSISTYLLLQPRLTDMILGFGLLSNGVNLLILFTSENPDARSVPIVAGTGSTSFVDPLPQALILTAIVIGFGLIAYLIILAFRLFGHFGTQETDHYMKKNQDE